MPLDDRTKIAHLLRRAGFGGTPAEIEEYAALGLRGAVDRLVDFESTPDDVTAGLDGVDLEMPSELSQRPRIMQFLQTWWFDRMIESRRPLQERMVFFWSGHFTSEGRKVQEPALMYRQNQLFRTHAVGRFEDLLAGVAHDGAMLRYLDQNVSRRERPNENFARELFELFTLGIGNYTEKDIKEAARALTGYTYNREGQFVFNRNTHDPGLKTVFGQTGNFNGDDIVRLVMAHPAMPNFIVSKLWGSFAYPNPEWLPVAEVTDAFKRSGFSIREAMRAMFLNPYFYSDKAYRANIKSPLELVIGTVRQLGLQTRNAQQLLQISQRMGQQIWNPPNVAGWPGGPAWLNATTWLERVNFANSISSRTPANGNMAVTQFLANGVGTDPKAAVDEIVWKFADGKVSDQTRATMQQFAGNRIDEANARALLYLMLASPEFQLA